jgi:hypothetical protein
MSEILNEIETDRSAWVDTRELVKKLKERLTTIEEQITDERAELVAAAGWFLSYHICSFQKKNSSRIKDSMLITRALENFWLIKPLHVSNTVSNNLFH